MILIFDLESIGEMKYSKNSLHSPSTLKRFEMVLCLTNTYRKNMGYTIPFIIKLGTDMDTCT